MSYSHVDRTHVRSHVRMYDTRTHTFTHSVSLSLFVSVCLSVCQAVAHTPVVGAIHYTLETHDYSVDMVEMWPLLRYIVNVEGFFCFDLFFPMAGLISQSKGLRSCASSPDLERGD